MKAVALPITPRIPKDLDEWNAAVEPSLELHSVLASGRDFSEVTRLSVDECRLEKCNFAGAPFEKLELTDMAGKRLESAGIRSHKSNLLRVELTDCRFTGADFPEASFEDCTFRNVKFDEAGFRFADLKRVHFEDCILRNTDFSNASLAHVTFTNCDFEAINFVSAKCTNVDMTTENLIDIKGVLGLKGATISNEQLVQIAPLLAAELGFHVKD